MSTQFWVLLALAALSVFWALGAYNRLVALRGAIGAAFEQVEELLRRRAAAIEPLDAALRGPLGDGCGSLDEVLHASAQVQAAAAAVHARPALAPRAASLAEADASLSTALEALLAQVEQHPELMAHETLAPHLAGLREALPQVAFARQHFNDAVARYNEAAQQFPTRLLSRLFGFGPAGAL